MYFHFFFKMFYLEKKYTSKFQQYEREKIPPKQSYDVVVENVACHWLMISIKLLVPKYHSASSKPNE